MIEPRHIPADDLALYAMQFLTPEETSAVEQHLRTCSECRRELANIQGDLAALAHTAEMHAAPDAARSRLMKQVGKEKKIIPEERPERRPLAAEAPVPFARYGKDNSSYFDEDVEEDAPRRGVGAILFAWSGWAVAAALAFIGFKIYQEREQLQQETRMNAAQIASLNEDVVKARDILDALADRNTQRVTLTKSDNVPIPSGRVLYRADKGMLLFLASNMEPAPPSKTYELWVIPAESGRAPIPAGTFKPDARGHASIVLPELPKGVPAKAFGVTIENDGGSQAPTLPIVMVGM